MANPEKAQEGKFSPRGGRKKITDNSGLTERINFRLDKTSYEKIRQSFQESGYESMTDYLKVRLINTQELYVVNPKEILKQLNIIGAEIGQIGKNINQLAKYANILQKNGAIDPSVLKELNTLLLEYGKERKELTNAIRSFLRRKK